MFTTGHFSVVLSSVKAVGCLTSMAGKKCRKKGVRTDGSRNKTIAIYSYVHYSRL